MRGTLQKARKSITSLDTSFPLIFSDSFSSVNSTSTQYVYLSHFLFFERKKLLFQHFFRYELCSQLLILFSQFPFYYITLGTRVNYLLMVQSRYMWARQFHDSKGKDNILMESGHLRINISIVTSFFLWVYIILPIIIIGYARISFNTKGFYVNCERFNFIKINYRTGSIYNIFEAIFMLLYWMVWE